MKQVFQLWCVVVLLMSTLPGYASGVEPAPEAGFDWHPPEPAPDGSDWIRLISGEWLKGEIRSLRDDVLEFESDNLEELTLDWEDVAELRSFRLHTYAFEDRTNVTGTALIREDRVLISAGGQEREWKREELTAIVKTGQRRIDHWSGKARLGLAFRGGNTSQTDLSYQGFLRRETAFTRIRLDFSGNLGVLEGVQNINDHLGNLKLDLFLTPRFYVTPASINVFYDKFQNIDLRLTPSAGVGYRLVKTSRVRWDVELAGGCQLTRYGSVTADGASKTERGALIPTTRVETEPFKRVDVDMFYQAQIGLPSQEGTVHHAEVVTSLELTKWVDLDVSWIWDRVQNPVREADGAIPGKDDFRLTVGIGLDF